MAGRLLLYWCGNTLWSCLPHRSGNLWLYMDWSGLLGCKLPEIDRVLRGGRPLARNDLLPVVTFLVGMPCNRGHRLPYSTGTVRPIFLDYRIPESFRRFRFPFRLPPYKTHSEFFNGYQMIHRDGGCLHFSLTLSEFWDQRAVIRLE